MLRDWKPFFVVFLALLGCGGSQAPVEFTGDASALPTMATLPRPGLALSERTAHMRMGLGLANTALLIPRPQWPTDRSLDTLGAWSDGPFREWLTRKSTAVERARDELDTAAEENERQRIIAGAVVGLLYEDIARVLRDVPVPSELDSEPEVARTYREVVAFDARTFMEQAKRAFRACQANGAQNTHGLGHFSEYCGARASALE